MIKDNPHTPSFANQPDSFFSREGGFTLVEELVAVAVIGLGLIILISMITTGVFGARTINNLVVAESLARSQIELIKDAPYQTDIDAYPTVTSTSHPDFIVTTQATILGTGLQMIKVSVSSGGKTLVEISSYKVDR